MTIQSHPRSSGNPPRPDFPWSRDPGGAEHESDLGLARGIAYGFAAELMAVALIFAAAVILRAAWLAW